VRHGRTAWNDAGRIQGHTDVPLTGRTRQELAGRALPARFDDFTWFASPLMRAVDTAQLLSKRAPIVEERLREMNWGDWEGRRLNCVAARWGKSARTASAHRAMV
jgi:probable phosphoglycerate mutase